ncbi:MAG: homoserine kinase [Actinomycetota bacterium]
MSCEVKVPATSANLGPGFDVLGVALGTHLFMRFTQAEVFALAGRGRLHPIPDNLTYRSFVSTFERAGKQAPPVTIETIGRYPSARGMGASASAIVAGLVGARAYGSLNLDDDALAELAVEIEGHPDNVLPALFGGLLLSVGTRWLRLRPTSRISPIVLVAVEGFKTKAARKVLPEQLSRADAIANAAATAALVAILTGSARPELLLEATVDTMHEPFRLPLMPASRQVHADLRAAGIATTLSGAGPSLLCLVESRDLNETVRTTRQLLPDGWKVLTPGWDNDGARVLET